MNVLVDQGTIIITIFFKINATIKNSNIKVTITRTYHSNFIKSSTDRQKDIQTKRQTDRQVELHKKILETAVHFVLSKFEKKALTNDLHEMMDVSLC